MTSMYDSDRVNRLAEISTKFTTAARVGDEIQFGIDGDKHMPAKYRGTERPKGVITRIKNEGTPNATLRVQLEKSGRSIDVHPFSIDGGRVWEYTDKGWNKVMARNGLGDATYKGTAASNELTSLRQEMSAMSQKFESEMAAAKEFQSALVESIAAMTGEIVQTNPEAKYSSTFQREYKGQSRMAREESLFDSDFED
jgi:hypothetical protein